MKQTKEKKYLKKQNWNFSIHDKQNAIKYYNKNGFVGFYDLLTNNDLKLLRYAIEIAIQKGRLNYGENEIHPNHDIIFAHPILEQYVKHPEICNMVRELIKVPIELHHALFNAKPLHSKTEGKIKWHQDYPFFPHTNFDLVSCGIHLDDENKDSGILRFVPGSHKLGLQSHCENGIFAKEFTGEDNLEDMPNEKITCNAGQVTFHHCLTLHKSDPKRHDGHRRLIVLQYRAQDAVQLSGVVWKSTGYQVAAKEIHGSARFPDGTVVENRGWDGKLIDMCNRFKPPY